MVGAAKATGGMGSIFGPGGVHDCGWDLVYAVNAALAVLGILELPEEDQPDMAIWGHDERLEEWFKALKQRRAGKFERIDDDDDDGMIRNELAERFRRG